MDSPHVSYFVGFDAVEIGRMQARSIERALRLKDPAGSDNIEKGQTESSEIKQNNGMRDVPAFLCKLTIIGKDNLESVHWAQ